MSKLQELIRELCPNGVEYRKLGEIVTIKNGKDYKHLGKGNIPVYGSGGIMTYVDTYAYNKPTVLIPRKGSLGNLFYVDTPFWNVDTIFYTDVDTQQINVKYLYYLLAKEHLENLNKAGGVPSLTQSILNKIMLPIPPLKVQEEIVRILDHFTNLTAELQAELQARKEQYEYYRNKLLTFDNIRGGTQSVTWMKMGEIGNICMCKRIMKEQTNTISGVPFYKIGTFGKSTDAYISRELYEDYKNRFSFPIKGEVLISASGTIGRSVIYDGKDAYFQDSNIVWIHNDETKVLNKYLYHYYRIIEWNVEGGTIKRLYNSNLAKTKIAVPSLSEQQRIVSILDKFEALANDFTEGLPAEIAAVQEQYEYYRNKLLSFPRTKISA